MSIVFITIGLYYIVIMIKSKKNPFSLIVQYLFFGIILVAGVYTFGTMAENIYYETKYVLLPYTQGEYAEVQGEVKNYKATAYDREIYFEVDNVNFHCSNYEIGSVGYQGNSLSEGEYVNIRYLEYKENIILRIEAE
ncbi:MAG: hypothetical protein NC397_08390 [Clostridium sp.]|nr:hypothetical protein [Clostridium sp.]